MARGDGAFLLDEERPDVFVASVGNLPPGKEVLLKIVYVTELARHRRGTAIHRADDRIAALRASRRSRGVGRPDADTLNPPLAWQVPYGLNLSWWRLDAARRSHPPRVAVTSDRSDSERTARRPSTCRSRRLRRSRLRPVARRVDLEVLDRPADNDNENDRHDVNAAEAHDSASTARIGFYPRMESARTPADSSFSSIDPDRWPASRSPQVRNALQLCLRSRSSPVAASTSWGSAPRFKSLFPRVVRTTTTSLAEASAHVPLSRLTWAGRRSCRRCSSARERARRVALTPGYRC